MGFPLPALTRSLWFAILERVPAKSRARLALVSRLWRALVADPEAWAALCFGEERLNDKMLRALAEKTAGRLRALDLSCLRELVSYEHGNVEAVKAAVLRLTEANADMLRRLKITASPPGVYATCLLVFRRPVAMSRTRPYNPLLPKRPSLDTSHRHLRPECATGGR